jgi:hypothetical protein
LTEPKKSNDPAMGVFQAQEENITHLLLFTCKIVVNKIYLTQRGGVLLEKIKTLK